MTRDDILRMAREAWSLEFIPEVDAPKLERFANLIAAAEREACAVVCDEYGKANEESDVMAEAFSHCAAAIRARGEA